MVAVQAQFCVTEGSIRRVYSAFVGCQKHTPAKLLANEIVLDLEIDLRASNDLSGNATPIVF